MCRIAGIISKKINNDELRHKVNLMCDVLKHGGPDDEGIYADADVMSMSHGQEVRVPFLDEDFRRTADSISPQIRFDEKQHKKILIDTFSNILPKAVWDRPKMGFSFPLQQWMSKHPAIADESFYKNKTTQRAITNFRNNRIHWSKAFALFQLQSHA